ncbi:MAG: ATPase domain-containing protein [Bacteroidota bacterium]
MTAAASTPTPSGIAALDAQWGGLRPGSAALLVGRAGAGRTTLALRAVQAAVEVGQTCLFLSPRAPEALQATARQAGLDLGALHKTGRMRVLRIPSAKDLAAKGEAGLDSAYRDLGGLAASAGAQRIVIEDFTPLVQYGTFEAFGEAFDGLRSAFADVGAAFLLGLGEPANAASQTLLDVVQARVDATVRIAPGASEPTVTVASPEPAATQPATPEPLAPEAPETAPLTTPDPFGTAPRAPFPPDPFADVPARPSAPHVPLDLSAPPAFPDAPSNDGASIPHEAPLGGAFPVDAPTEPPAPEPLAPEAVAPDPFAEATAPAGFAPFSPEPAPPEASGEAVPADPFGADGPAPPSGILRADVEPAPAPDPELLTPKADMFARDPGHSFFEGGYLVDSRGAKTIPVSSAAPEPPPPAQPAPEAPAPIEPVPSFAPLGGPTAPASDNGAAATRAALESAFASRASGAPFLVVAARMESSQHEAAHFTTVVEGLRAALPPGASLYADTTRLRSLLVIPGATASGAAQVFGTLQQHLSSRLGPQAEPTLQAVAAITVPDGQPFGSAQELWAYAVES